MSPFLALLLVLTASQVTPLRNAHAHNDYEHTRPLFDALDQGFNSVEADVFLVDGKLLVGHTRNALRPERTLEKLYLDPLRDRAKSNAGFIYPKERPFFLLIDIKTAGPVTYAALDPVLAHYADLLTEVRDNKVEERAVTVVISGNCPRQEIQVQKVRFAGMDGRLKDLDSDLPAHLMPWISDHWGNLSPWKGEGKMPDKEHNRLQEIVRKAHAHGRRVRFWATPENENVWRELRSAGVDLLNTDDLAGLRRFLLTERGK